MFSTVTRSDFVANS